MRAMVLAAGLGTRLKPWTIHHPKALVPVDGVPMLERILSKLEAEGFGEIIVNVHHFGDQIVDFLENRESGANIIISDERKELLDTGGGIVQAIELTDTEQPLLIHNVDILSNASLRQLMKVHVQTGADATLLTSQRDSSRKLVFDADGRLKAWIDLKSGLMRPEGISYEAASVLEEAFSGIYIMGTEALKKIREWTPRRSFPIMEFLLAECGSSDFRHYCVANLKLLDIGKPDALSKASDFLSSLNNAMM